MTAVSVPAAPVCVPWCRERSHLANRERPEWDDVRESSDCVEAYRMCQATATVPLDLWSAGLQVHPQRVACWTSDETPALQERRYIELLGHDLSLEQATTLAEALTAAVEMAQRS